MECWPIRLNRGPLNPVPGSVQHAGSKFLGTLSGLFKMEGWPVLTHNPYREATTNRTKSLRNSGSCRLPLNSPDCNTSSAANQGPPRKEPSLRMLRNPAPRNLASRSLPIATIFLDRRKRRLVSRSSTVAKKIPQLAFFSPPEVTSPKKTVSQMDSTAPRPLVPCSLTVNPTRLQGSTSKKQTGVCNQYTNE